MNFHTAACIADLLCMIRQHAASCPCASSITLLGSTHLVEQHKRHCVTVLWWASWQAATSNRSCSLYPCCRSSSSVASIIRSLVGHCWAWQAVCSCCSAPTSGCLRCFSRQPLVHTSGCLRCFSRQPLVHTSEVDAEQLVRLLARSCALAKGHATNPTDNRTALECSASPDVSPAVGRPPAGALTRLRCAEAINQTHATGLRTPAIG
jgi:hypothetical protein